MMYELAGEIGAVDPWPYSFRQLDRLATARRNAAWDHTSEILAMLHNLNRGKSRPKSSKDYHPKYRNSKRNQPANQLTAKQHVAMLRAMLIPKNA